MAVPYTFGTATAAIPLSQLDSNFATAITLGNTAVYLGNTTTSIGNLTLTNVTISSGEVTTGNVSVAGNVTLTGGTANGVAYLNTSKVLTTGSALVFDGSNLGLGVTPSAWSLGKAIEFGNLGSAVWSYGPTFFTTNYYYNSVDKFAGTGYALTYVQSKSGGSHSWNVSTASGTAGNTATMTQAMTLDASGNLGVGTTSPAAKFDAFQSSVGTYFLGGGGDNKARQLAITSSTTTNSGDTHTINAQSGTGILAFAISSSEKARIDSSGNLLVQTTNASISSGIGHKLHTDPTAPYIATTGSSTSNVDGAYFLYSTGVSQYRFYVGYGGTVYATNTTISAISDIRYKENVRDLDVGLDKIMALKPRLYDWKEGKGADIKNARGFIAQEFEEVFPDLIDEWRDPAPEGEEPYKSVRQDLIPVLVKAIQEQQALITQLQADVAALKGA